MSRSGALWGATIGAVLVYSSAVLFSLPPALYFFPRLGSWATHAIAGEPAIRWYGWLIYMAAGGLAGMVVGHVVNRRAPWAPVWGMTTLAMVLLAWHERHWFLH